MSVTPHRCLVQWRFVVAFMTSYALALLLASGADATSRFNAQQWQTADGLPHNTVQAICQTQDGYLWVGTRDGIARFDGLRFLVFNEKTTPELKGRNVTALAETKDGSLWIGTEGTGLTRLKDGKFSHYDERQGFKAHTVRSLLAATDGTLWAGSLEGLSCFKDEQFNQITNELASNVIRDLFQSRDGTIWIATDLGVSCVRDGVISRFRAESGWTFVRSVLVDQEKRVWMGNMDGILRVEGEELRHFRKADGLPDRVISLIRQDSAGNIWIATTGGLCSYAGDKLITETTSDGEGYDVVNAIFEDREKNLWIGAKDGLYRLNPRQFITLTKQQGLPHNNVMSVLQDKAGALWVATWGGGLTKMHDGTNFTYNATHGFTSDLALSLHETRDGRLWVGMDFNDGIYHMEGEHFTHYSHRDGLMDPAVFAILEDRNRNVWIGTRTALNRFRDRTFTRFGATNGFGGSGVRAIHEGADGAVWFGANDGLWRWNDETFTPFKSPGLTNVCAIHDDGDGTLWLGTRGNGMARFKQGEFTLYTTRNGLFDDNVFEILDDNAGFFWISSLRGIFRVSKQQLDGIATGKSAELECIAYGKADGVLNPQCNGVAKPSAWKSQDGRLWFATTKGVVTTDPAITIARNEVAPPVVIETVLADKHRVDGESARPASASLQRARLLKIEPGHGELEFRYTALSFCAPDKIQFKYKLEGVDEDWIEAGTRRVAHYNNIYPGNYRFTVIACNNDGVWNETGTSVNLALLPHFWQTWWFVGLLSISGMGALVGTVRYVSVRKLQRQLTILEKETAIATERSRIAQDMHDDLGARLTQILLLSDLAKGSKGNPDDMEKHVERIAGAAQDVASNLDGIVWAVNPENDSLDRLVGYIHEFTETFLAPASIRCRVEAPREFPQVPLSSEVRHNLFLVVKETLNNMMKHSGASEVRVRFHVDNTSLTISIEDNGKGFSTEVASAYGNGLRNMQKRMDKVGGKFVLKSSPGTGTQTSIDLPINGTPAVGGG